MSTRAKYQRVNGKSEWQQSKSDTDIILKKSDRYGKYIGRALKLFFDEKKPFVVLKAAQKIIQRAIWVAQVLKRKVGGLHQVTRISEKKIVDVYAPKEQGLVEVKLERFLTVVQILLTKQPKASEKAEVGYQQPIKVDDRDLLNNEKWEKQKEQRAERRRKYQQGGEQNRNNDRRNRGERREGGDRRQGGQRRERRQDRGQRRQDRGQRRQRREDRGQRREGGDRRQGGQRRERRQDRGQRRQDNRGQKREQRGGERRRGRNNN